MDGQKGRLAGGWDTSTKVSGGVHPGRKYTRETHAQEAAHLMLRLGHLELQLQLQLMHQRLLRLIHLRRRSAARLVSVGFAGGAARPPPQAAWRCKARPAHPGCATQESSVQIRTAQLWERALPARPSPQRRKPAPPAGRAGTARACGGAEAGSVKRCPRETVNPDAPSQEDAADCLPDADTPPAAAQRVRGMQHRMRPNRPHGRRQRGRLTPATRCAPAGLRCGRALPPAPPPRRGTARPRARVPPPRG